MRKNANARFWSEPNPGLPLGQGRAATHTHDYYRHGTVTRFSVLNYLNEKILAKRAFRHRHHEWLKILKAIDSSTPAAFDLHLILDKYVTHKHHKVMRRFAAYPRFHFHCTPTSASWINRVERIFCDLSQYLILPVFFENTNEFVGAIWGYLA